MSQGLQRALAVLLLLLVVAVVVVAGVIPLAAQYAAREERIATLQERVLRYERIAARSGAARAELAALERAASLERGSFGEATMALAAASLQERLRELVAGAGGVLASTRVMPEREAGPFVAVSVEARARLDVAGLQQVVYGLESGERLLRIDQLTVRAINRGVRRANKGVDTLDVQLQVLGFRRAANGGGG